MKRVAELVIVFSALLFSSASAAPEAHMMLVYWDADDPASGASRSSLVDQAVLQPCVVPDVDENFYERTGSGHHFNGVLVGFVIAFDRPESKRKIFHAAFSDYDRAVEYVSRFPNHHLFPKPQFAQ
jgi:hypothetical protein